VAQRRHPGSTSATGSGARAGLRWLLSASLVSGVAGYLTLWTVARTLGATDYAVFGVFWSALFLIVGVLFGLQQESTRATAEAIVGIDGDMRRSSLLTYAIVAAFLVVAIVSLSSIWWATLAFGAGEVGLWIQVASGAGFNAIVAVSIGMFAGASRWRLVALMVVVDGVLRLVGVLVALALGATPAALAWAVVLPFPVTMAVAIVAAPRLLVRLSRSPLGYSQLASNSLHTVAAASATAVLINGFPLVLSFFADQGESAELGALIFAITLTRAPLLVPLMALQSFLVTRFTTQPGEILRGIRTITTWIAATVAVLGILVAVAGEWALEVFVGPEFGLGPVVLVILVVSSGLIAVLCTTGPALLASGRHRAYAVGWVVASIVAVVMLFAPVGLEVRASLALTVGPLAGIVVHICALRAASRASLRAPVTR
jgi:O-antigen/teichoic acid export membrane protein